MEMRWKMDSFFISAAGLLLFVLVLVLASLAGRTHGSPSYRTPMDEEDAFRKPNIVFFIGDDIGYNDVGWTNPQMYTPHMNQLARDGIIFDNFYAMSLCSPSRATLMTGRYAQELGLQRNVLGLQEPYGVPLSFPFLSEVLRYKGNYATHAIGKWHLGYCDEAYTPTRRGFDSFLGFYNGGEENYFHCNSKHLIYRPISNCTGLDFRKDLAVGTEYNGQYSAYVYSERAVEIIKSHHHRKPLFMYISFTDTHFPLQAPERFEKNCGDNINPARYNFCAAMAAIDEAVSNVTKALKRANLYENTIMVFASDNGGTIYFGGNNYPLRGGKGSLWEGGCRVPAFIHSPLLKKQNEISKDLFHIVDWFPTFLEAAQIDQDGLQLSGLSHWSALKHGQSQPVRTEFPYQYDEINGTFLAAIRVNDWKLIAGPGGDDDEWTTENQTMDESFNSQFLTSYIQNIIPFDLEERAPKLFNLKDDPYERNDLAAKEPKKVKELLTRLDFYRQQAKPAVKMAPDPAGDPDNFGQVYSSGWCKAFVDVPVGTYNSTTW